MITMKEEEVKEVTSENPEGACLPFLIKEGIPESESDIQRERKELPIYEFKN